MMTFLAKIGELSLKGSNLREFENALIRNTKKYFADCEGVTVTLRAGRMYIECDDCDSARVEFALSHLLGITGWAKCTATEKNISAISEAVVCEAEKAKERGAVTFKVDARRADKKFPLDSYAIAREAGAAVCEKNLLQVNVHKPDVKISVEVREKYAYVYSNANTGRRGLPVGVSGKGLLLLSGGLDSPVAGYRMFRRGMNVDCVYFHSYPYTSMEAQQKVETLAQSLADYGLETHLNIVQFTDVQMRIKEKSPEAWTTLMLRVCMMKCANMIANRVHAQCIITGESLGQVASQTIENMSVTEHFSAVPMMRPLVGLDKEEIVATANEIGTFETSILPYEDCCVLFSPRHPVLRGTAEEAEKIYASLDVDSMIAESYEKREVKKFVAKMKAN